MYFLDMMNIDFGEKLNYIKISVMAIVFVALVCLTIIAIMKEKIQVLRHQEKKTPVLCLRL